MSQYYGESQWLGGAGSSQASWDHQTPPPPPPARSGEFNSSHDEAEIQEQVD